MTHSNRFPRSNHVSDDEIEVLSTDDGRQEPAPRPDHDRASSQARPPAPVAAPRPHEQAVNGATYPPQSSAQQAHRPNTSSDPRFAQVVTYNDEPSARLALVALAAILVIAIPIPVFMFLKANPQLLGLAVAEPATTSQPNGPTNAVTISGGEKSNGKTSHVVPDQRVTEHPPADEDASRSDLHGLADITNLDEAFARFKVDYLDSQRYVSRLAAKRDGQARITTAMAQGFLELYLSDDPASTNVVSLAYVPPGNFQMGHTEEQRLAGNRASSASHFDFSTPSHPVRIKSAYFIGIYEIPHFQFQAFLDATGATTPVDKASVASSKVDRIKPITNVTWETAVAFCDWLSELNQMPVRLPTEIEWEYAARGNHFVQQYESDRESDALIGGPWPVDHKTLDRQWRGTIGMRGNVQEWCLDVWNERAYDGQVVRRNKGKPSSFVYSPSAQSVDKRSGPHVVRGANYRDARANKDPALRRYKAERSSDETVGFRIVVPVSLPNDSKGDQ